MNYVLNKANSVHQPSVYPPYLPYNYDILESFMFLMVKDSISGSGDLLSVPCMHLVPRCAS